MNRKTDTGGTVRLPSCACATRLAGRAPRLQLCLALCLLSVQAAWSADFDPSEKSILELQLAMSTGLTRSVDLVDFYLARIERLDGQGPILNSMARINPTAREMALALDRERAEGGPRGPLHGIPLVVKDNFETRSMATQAGSLALRGFAPDQDAELVRRLRDAGAVILGKTNMHEFAYGIESVGSAFGVTRNPYDPRRNPGGSSGGTGAAVAANFASVGLGSDTCGSIRDPAAHNALVGLRGTQGSSSRRGIIPLSSTQDIGGPLARSVTDLALVLDVITGYDPGDPQTAASIGRFDQGFTQALNPDALRGARIGIVANLLRQAPADEAVARVFDGAATELRGLGAETVEVSTAGIMETILAVEDGFYVLVHDFGRDIDRYLAAFPEAPVGGIRDILDGGQVIDSVHELIASSLAVQVDPPEVYLGELAKRDALAAALHELMAKEDLDALAYPTLTRIAAPVGEVQQGDNCHLAAVSGFPAITVPAGFTAEGLPVGLELLGRPWEDAKLLGLAYAFEQATRHRRPPPLPEP
ncbi:MAG: amidase family protein [Halieaceae bacterium]|jgi:Asp-tRNA(Asn)/Glu-tRNA(Gln) amidotransferase A subunit family amidase|nr:amidase family protein [Halieaceae bacterium]